MAVSFLVILLFAAFVLMLLVVTIGVAIAATGKSGWGALLALLCFGGLLLGLLLMGSLFYARSRVARPHAIRNDVIERVKMTEAISQQRAIDQLSAEMRAIDQLSSEMGMGYELESTPADESATDTSSDAGDATDVEEIDLKPAPEWIKSEPQYEGEVHTATVACGPYLTLDECQQNLQTALRQATDKYVQWYLAQNGRTMPPMMLTRPVALPSYNAEEDVFDQQRQFSPGPMITRHVRLRFDDEFRKMIDRKWEESLIAQRLNQTGKVAVTVLGLCGLSFIGLRLRCRKETSCRR